MLLTSAGLKNEILESALADLVGTPFAAARLAFIPTASVAEAGDHGWFVEELSRLHGLGWREFDIVELNGLPPQAVLARLRHADVLYAEGGNHYHLANSIIANGLAEEMAAIVEAKVYVGVSAGSMIFSRNLSERTGVAFREQDDLRILGETRARSPFGLFDWYLKPHLNSPSFPGRTLAWFEKAAAKVDFPVYALDDDSAVRVRGDGIDVVSSGQWRLLNAPAPDVAERNDPRTDRPGQPARLPAFLARLSRGNSALPLSSRSRDEPGSPDYRADPASDWTESAETAGLTRPDPRRARRATDRASWAAVWCVPATNRTPGPRLTAVWAPAKYRPRIDDSPARFTRGQLARFERADWMPSDRNDSRATSTWKPVPAMTWSTSTVDSPGLSRLSRTPLP